MRNETRTKGDEAMTYEELKAGYGAETARTVKRAAVAAEAMADGNMTAQSHYERRMRELEKEFDPDTAECLVADYGTPMPC